MTARSDANRRRWAARLGFSAAFMAALAFAVVAQDAASRRPATVTGLVAPDWTASFDGVRKIRVVTASDSLTITAGSDGVWSIAERGGYRVEPSALTQLHRSLSAMAFSGALTRDPANHERLGVTDPAQGGSGVRLTTLDASGAPLEDLIFGGARAGGVFLRRPGEDQAYASVGEPPALADPSYWLDLDFLKLDRVEIAETRIVPEGDGEPYRLARGAPAASDFVLLEPGEGYELITTGAANGPGGAMAGLRFVDVRPASPDDPAPVGAHAVRTFDGVDLALAVLRIGDDAWVSVSAAAVDPEDEAAVAQAAAIDARVTGWLYKLPPYAAERLIRPLSGIARPR